MFCNFLTKFFCILLALHVCHGLDKVEVTGEGCKLTEPIYNSTFDLSGLQSDLSHQVQLGRKDSIEFNLCGAMSKACDNSSGVGACLTAGGKEKILGREHTLKLSNGRFHFEFSGDKCSDTKNFTFSVILQCDFTSVKDMISVQKSTDKCSHSVVLRTKLACIPTESKVLDSCSASLNAFTTFNLYSLAGVNHVADDRNGGTFLINICRPVMWDLDAMCPPDTGVCFVNRSETDLTKRFVSMGAVEKPSVEEGVISVKMTGTEACPEDATRKISSVITFECEKSSRVDEVEFIGFRDCEYKFVWSTAAVCETLEPCTAVDPKTGFKYDLRPLSKKPFNVTHDNHTYAFGICASPRAPCLESSGACEIFAAETRGLGLVNDKLLVNQTGAPYLKYEGGGLCQSTKQPWYSVIEFVCAEQGMQQGPKVIENTDCRLIIQFVTDAICQTRQISCQTTNNSFDAVIDLAPLIRNTDNYVANVSAGVKGDDAKRKYFINVCRPLVPQYGLSCPGGSAICQATIENGKPESEKSLGYPDVSLTMVGARAQLKYLRGSPCPADKDTELSSVIDFYCDAKSGRGNPVLKSVTHDCLYEFEWATNVVCPAFKCEFSKKHCSIHNEQTDSDFDLSDLVKSNAKLDKLKFCELDKYEVMADYAQGSVKVFTSAKEKSDNSEKTVNIELRLNCNGDEKNSSSKDNTLGRLLVTYETPSICSMLGLDPPPASPSVTTPDEDKDKDKKDGDKKEAEGGVSAVGTVFIVLAILGSIGGIGFALKDPERRAKVLSLIRRKDTNVTYSRDFYEPHYSI
ncbi:cation-independent mannose-6-phosphate receptor isoform X2 [Phlebotomus argentipes]|uniref:cation-independent mannose-6-phosphate receptor isoform X2 n=1 Tax=Phlebotomus argentipes TaxID=94469 RepID=UPI0028937D2B|nr:cation-independent mannose-6-phosphate receptor isoform X2 [Phlebotomus argentipes]